MKAGFLRTIFVAVLLSMACSGTWAQNKTQAYYNSHEREILPDARTAFKSGDYARTAELCRWHYIIVGDRAADALRDQAERCGQYASRMAALKDEGKNSEAKAAAQALLAINPDDLAARKLVEEIEALEKAEHERELERQRELEKQQELERQRELEAQKVSEETAAVEKPVEESVKEVLDIDDTPDRPVTPSTTPARKPASAEVKDNQFIVKAGATLFLKPFAIAPGAGVGLYNLGGSPVGVEAGLYFGSLAEKTASLFGLDAAVAFRASGNIYPKAYVGFFSCKSSVTGSGTNGLCAGAGLTFLVGGHFAVEAGLKYYPKVNVSGTTPVSTAGTTYDFPTPVEVLGGGIAPMVSIGWAF